MVNPLISKKKKMKKLKSNFLTKQFQTMTNFVNQGGGSYASGLAKGLEKQIPVFHMISKANRNEPQRNAFIDNMNSSQMKGVQNLMGCFLNKKIELAPHTVKRLKRDSKYFYSLADKNVPNDLKKKILKQKGGIIFAPLIAKLAPTLLSAVAGPILEKVFK